METLWPWLVLVALGAYHGLNPGMGWLFAVSRGLQERSRRAVLASLGPIALGHMASVAAVVALVAVAQPYVEVGALRLAGALALLAFGVYKLVARAHPRWVGMRVGLRELALWSFLMATAHGAGLMLVPVVLQLPAGPAHAAHHAPAAVESPAHDHAAHDHAAHGHAAHRPPATDGRLAGIGSVVVHTVAMFAAMTGAAVLVYERLGLAVLRRAWLNLDLLWAWSLIAAGVLALPWPYG